MIDGTVTNMPEEKHILDYDREGASRPVKTRIIIKHVMGGVRFIDPPGDASSAKEFSLLAAIIPVAGGDNLEHVVDGFFELCGYCSTRIDGNPSPPHDCRRRLGWGMPWGGDALADGAFLANS